MARRRRFTLVLVPHNKNKVRHLGGPFVLCCGIMLLFVFALGIWSIGSTYVVSLFDGGKLASLERENNLLTARLNELTLLTETFRKQMDVLAQREKEARLVVGLPDIHPDVREVGIGGPAAPDLAIEEAGSSTALAADIRQNLDQLLREAELEMASLKSIEEKGKLDSKYWRHIPTVRPVGGPASSQYGMREDPFTGLWRMHAGFDISARRGEPVRATADGIILRTGVDLNYGRYIDIDHQNGYLTRYGHLSVITAKRNAEVKRGDVIGQVGKTGRATGYHLHYEVRHHDRVVDPSAYFFPERMVVD